ncbi:MAG: hypothetical protein Q8Q39_02650 [bacterium]|nr:hypothetical protein [bacterium]
MQRFKQLRRKLFEFVIIVCVYMTMAGLAALVIKIVPPSYVIWVSLGLSALLFGSIARWPGIIGCGGDLKE